MLTRLFNRRTSRTDVPQHLYGRVVAQARCPHFFEAWELPDTPMGRFELLSLHMFVLSHRLAQEDDATAASLSQETFDEFVSDLDRALRQLGIGDISVPKRKKRLVATFYTQIEQLSAPLTAENVEAIASSPLIRGIAGVTDYVHADELADYFVTAKRRLSRQSMDELIAVGPEWPVPGEVQ
jgi:cytochrome b pre-mRNA-processing protein 3